MVLEFYYDLLSQPCRSLYMFLKMGKVAFEPKVLSLVKGDHHSPEFLKKTRFHAVPVIDDNGFVLTETVAIMRYIAVKYDVADHLYPRADPEKQARCDEFLNWQHTGLRKHCVETFLTIFRGRVGVGRFTKQPIDEEKLAASKKAVGVAVEHLAEYFINGKPFICGDEISAADLMALNELVQLEAVGMQDLYLSNKQVADWVGRVTACSQPYFDEAQENRMKVAEMYKNAKE